jgi:hypothetical protein
VKAVSPISYKNAVCVVLQKRFIKTFSLWTEALLNGAEKREKNMCFDAYLKSNLFLEWRF